MFFPLDVFEHIKTLPFLFLFTYMHFCAFLSVKSFCKKKKKKSQNCPNDLIYITTIRIGRFLVQNPLGTRPGLGTQPRYEAPGDLRFEHVQTQ